MTEQAKIVYTYETFVSVPLSEQDARFARKALNKAHGYEWAIDIDAPPECEKAHQRLCVSLQQKMIVDVFSDGRRRIR